jgi:hypothetical protein
MGRKTVAGRALKEARAMSVPKAFRLSISKSADTLFDLALAVIGATQSVMTQSDLCAVFAADKLMLLLDGPNGQPGAALMDPAVVSGLVQQQTMGRVTAATDDERAMTRTDAAMMAPLLNDVFERVTTLLETEDDRAILRGFQFGAQVLDPRLIGLSLEENEYHVLRLTLDVAAGTRQGDVLLAFPVASSETMADPYGGSDSAGQSHALHDTVMAVKTELDAIICKVRIPLRDIEQWTVGTSLAVERDTLNETALYAQTGRKLGVGKLGQKSGFRALRLVKKTASYSGPDRRGMHGLLAGDDDMPAESAAVPSFDTAPAAEPMMPDTLEMPDMAAAPMDLGEGGMDPVDLSTDLPDLPPMEFDAEGDGLPDLPPLEFDPDSDDLPELPPLSAD